MTKILMVSAIIFPVVPLAEPPKVTTGYWSYYAEGPTTATIAYRQSVGDLPLDLSGYDGVIAVADCKLIGREAWIKVENSKWLKVLVFDCSGHVETSRWMEENRIIGELGYGLARQLDTPGRGGVPGRMMMG